MLVLLIVNTFPTEEYSSVGFLIRLTFGMVCDILTFRI